MGRIRLGVRVSVIYKKIHSHRVLSYGSKNMWVTTYERLLGGFVGSVGPAAIPLSINRLDSSQTDCRCVS